LILESHSTSSRSQSCTINSTRSQ